MIENHINSSYPLYSAESYQRWRFYPPPYYYGGTWYYATPWLWYDGDPHGSYTYSTWESKIVTEMNRPAPFTCTMWGTYSLQRGSGTVYAKFRNDSTASVTGRIRFVLTEDSLYYAAPNGDNWHNHVARDYLPDTSGTPVTLAPGESITVSRNFTVQSGWNANRCEIVTWIQSTVLLSDSTRDVWQGGLIKVSQLTAVEEDISQNPILHNITPIPNPCVDRTKFTFRLEKGNFYEINIFDVTGRKIRMIKGYATGDKERIEWDLKDDAGKKVVSGVYFYRFISPDIEKSGKIVTK
ncbi:MAG: Omp28-related outer membrane protein [bacterium]